MLSSLFSWLKSKGSFLLVSSFKNLIEDVHPSYRLASEKTRSRKSKTKGVKEIEHFANVLRLKSPKRLFTDLTQEESMVLVNLSYVWSRDSLLDGSLTYR